MRSTRCSTSTGREEGETAGREEGKTAGREEGKTAGREEGKTDWVTGVRTSTVEIGGQRREFRVRLYTATELVAMLADAGFGEVEVVGDFDRTPLDPTTRLAIRAVRS